MTPGAMLRRLARAACSADLCDRVLEPAIADFQHDLAHATGARRRLHALLHGYAAFWQSLGWCVAQDASSRDARQFNGRAAVAFVLAVSAAAAIEAMVMHTSPTIHRFVVMHFPYVGFSARTDTATLRFGIPLAMFPALFRATRRSAHFTRATALWTISFGASLTFIASGWLAPSVERWHMLQQRDHFIVATGGRYYMSPVEWEVDRYTPAKSSSDLIRGALAPDPHRFPGYPRYVAPEDRDLQRYHRLAIYDRLALIALAVVAGLAGWIFARRRPQHSRARAG
jgi:hypothetical protein